MLCGNIVRMLNIHLIESSSEIHQNQTSITARPSHRSTIDQNQSAIHRLCIFIRDRDEDRERGFDERYREECGIAPHNLMAVVFLVSVHHYPDQVYLVSGHRQVQYPPGVRRPPLNAFNGDPGPLQRFTRLSILYHE